MKVNKLLLILTLFILSIQASFSQVPQLINYQAVVRDGSGSIQASSNIDVRFSLLENSNVLYEETNTITTTANGLLNTIVGSGTPTVGVFSSVDWSTPDISLKVEIDMGTGYIDMGTNLLNSVPYALYAENAESAETATYSDTSTVALSSLDQLWEPAYGGSIVYNDTVADAGSFTAAISTSTPITGSTDVLRLSAPSGSSSNMDFIQFQIGSTTINPPVATIKGDGSANFLKTTNELDFGETGTPVKGATYRDNTAIAWAYVNANGTIESSFGILSVVSLGSGIYYVYLDNPYVGYPAVSITGYQTDSQGLTFGNVHAIANSNQIRVYTGTVNGTSLTVIDRSFHIIVFGRPN